MTADLFHSLLGNLWSVFLILLFFGGSIFVHELGHFLAARRRGVKVTRFSIGFGPAIWSHRAKDGVEYRLSWIPLGGYVALPQLADMAAIEGDEAGDETLHPISYGTRMIVFAAGAFFNVLFAFALASILWVIGQPTSEEMSTTRLGYIVPTIALADGTLVPSPALEAGLRVGDVVHAIDGTKVSDWPELQQILVTSAGVAADGRRRAVFSIERNGRLIDLTVYPQLGGEDGIRRVGISPAYTPIVSAVADDSLAQTLGLKVDDRVISLNHTPLLNLAPLAEELNLMEPEAFTLTVERDGDRLDFLVPAERPQDTNTWLGVAFRTKYGLKYTNPVTQLTSQVSMTLRVLVSLIQPRSDIGISKLSGPIGIGKIYWDASEAGIRYVLWIAILVNINLAVFNLLPIPVLDGGHMLFATIGKLRGRALPVNFIATAQSVFIVLLFGMILYVSVFDIKRIVRDNRAPAAQQEKSAAPAKP